MIFDCNVLSIKQAAKFCNFFSLNSQKVRKIGDFPYPIKLSQRKIAYKKMN